jgi:hypothetical protein
MSAALTLSGLPSGMKIAGYLQRVIAEQAVIIHLWPSGASLFFQ